MSWWAWLLVGLGALVFLYGALVLALLAAGRRQDIRAIAGFIPDCLVLFGRLMKDRRLRFHHKLPLGLLMVYLASPLDIVPDFIPVAGQLDDVLLAAWALRRLVRGDPALVIEHWPGPASSLNVLLRLAGARSDDRENG
jgi:uncharacterized membrane protein YkvA (DUF1232 family)